MKCLKATRRIYALDCVKGITPHTPRGNTMSRRLTLLVAALLIASLSGCVILPEHRHCCWRYYGAADTPSQVANS
jgi:hypothetical protein